MPDGSTTDDVDVEVPQILVSTEGDVEQTDQFLESAIHDILFNVERGLDPAFLVKIRLSAHEDALRKFQRRNDLSLVEKKARNHLLAFLNRVRRHEPYISGVLRLLFRSRVLRWSYVVSGSDYVTVAKACCRRECALFSGALVPEGWSKLDIWQPRGQKLATSTYLSEAEWELFEREYGIWIPAPPIELIVLSRETIREKALPAILSEIVRRKGKLTDDQVEECLNLSGWVVGAG